ncbi:MAG: PilZ domain-containing protein [Desulforhopalus sp.]|nr:PilZ domain-containing protein [Desulforhopalus sp.]
MKKRRHQRVEVQNLVANLSDGVEFFSATVCNISRLGILLNDIPQKLKSQGKKLSIIVSAKGRNFRMQVQQKWVSGNTSEGKMGVEILDPPMGWTVFAMICEPKDEDIWAATTHLPGF